MQQFKCIAAAVGFGGFDVQSRGAGDARLAFADESPACVILLLPIVADLALRAIDGAQQQSTRIGGFVGADAMLSARIGRRLAVVAEFSVHNEFPQAGVNGGLRLDWQSR